MSIEMENNVEKLIKIKVVGIGGGGNNVVNRMVKSGVQHIDFVAVNTDIQALNASSAGSKIQIGIKLTKGQGAGADPDKGEKSAIENKAEIEEALLNTDMVFITAGMGGGTGTGGAPVVAEIAKSLGILTVGVVTRPFRYEGPLRRRKAEAGILELQSKVDSLVIISNDRIKECAPEGQKLTVLNGMAIADSVLEQAVLAVSDLIQKTAFINLDFADISAVMKDGGRAHMGYGRAKGSNRAEQAARMAIASPLMEYSVKGAKGFIVYIAGPTDLDMEEVEQAMDIVNAESHADVELIYGANFDDSLEDEMRVTVIATGFDYENETPKVQTPFSDAQKRTEEGAEPLAVEPQPTTTAFHQTPLEATRPFTPIEPHQVVPPLQPLPEQKPAPQLAPEPFVYSVPNTMPGVPVTYAIPTPVAPEPERQSPDEDFDDIVKMFRRD
ncbi:MAG: cell division protein FtsZ [Eubacteriales bacterium]